MKNVMLDLEAMGTGADAAVIQIGATYFNFSGATEKTFLINVDLSDELREGFKTNGSTILWWLEQSDAARKSILESDEILPSRNSWRKLNNFLGNADQIWSHATFDFVIAMNHIRGFFGESSFSYRTARDIRTLVDLSGLDLKQWCIDNPRDSKNIAHNALDDCYYQIQYCCDAMSVLKGEIV